MVWRLTHPDFTEREKRVTLPRIPFGEFVIRQSFRDFSATLLEMTPYPNWDFITDHFCTIPCGDWLEGDIPDRLSEIYHLGIIAAIDDRSRCAIDVLLAFVDPCDAVEFKLKYT